MEASKTLMRKIEKRKEDEQTLGELSSAHRRAQAKCQLVQTSSIERIKIFLFAIQETSEQSWFVWENLDLGRVFRPHYKASRLCQDTPPARLIRANYFRRPQA